MINSPTVVSGECFAPDGIQVVLGGALILNAGTTIVMPAGSQIRVEGDIAIRGSPSKWVYLCCEKKGPASWKGIWIERRDRAVYQPLMVSGLVISDAERGIDMDVGQPPARAFAIRDSMFLDNAHGLCLNQFGQGLDRSSSGWIENCIFAQNTEAAAWHAKRKARELNRHLHEGEPP